MFGNLRIRPSTDDETYLVTFVHSGSDTALRPRYFNGLLRLIDFLSKELYMEFQAINEVLRQIEQGNAATISDVLAWPSQF